MRPHTPEEILMIRRMKHAVRWVGFGALLAYLFDPERGRARRETVRTRATQMIDRAKESMTQMRGEAEDVVAHVQAPPPSYTGDTSTSSTTPATSRGAAAV
jgi:gas vesicle protein